MPSEVAITFYKISTAGYYAIRLTDRPVFGNVETILNDLKIWSKDKVLQDTRTVSVEAETELFPTYLASIDKKYSKWLLTMWNQVPDTDGTILSLPGQSRVGAATAHENDIEPGTIPGFATYFWFIPEKNMFATLKIDQPQICQLAMQSHVKNFMSLHSSHIVKTEVGEDGEIKILGYRQDDDSDTLRVYPRFSARIHETNGDKSYILDNAEKIRKFSRKEDFSLVETQNAQNWQKKIRAFIPGYKKPLFLQNATTEQSFTVSLTREYVTILISEWEQNYNVTNAVDYSFEMRADPKKYWLSHAYARDKFSLNLNRDANNNGIINPQSLLDELERQKHTILSLLDDV